MKESVKIYTVPTSMEPLFPNDPSGELKKLSIELIKCSARLSGSLHVNSRKAIADFLGPMNSYYSNLIEGHDTHPIDIEKALKGNYSNDRVKSNYQKEAHAHIEVHKFIRTSIDRGDLNHEPSSAEFLKLIHQKFYDHLPESFRKVITDEGHEKVVTPGEFRKGEVKVGNHLAPSHAHLPDFLNRFDLFYSPGSKENKDRVRRIVSIAASHHRLAWIHPFLDGNGRVVRLFSDASFLIEGLDASGLWSISRGLARNNELYKSKLANADSKRRGDYDGRGNLSNNALVEFCKFFLEIAIDQVEYMSRILETDSMVRRLEGLAELLVIKKNVKKESKYILVDLFVKGSISKSDVMRITNTSDKTAKRITDQLDELGLLKVVKEPGKKAIYFPKYPISFSPSLFPGLYPSSKETDLLMKP